jgi:hypothetical protein
MRRRERGLLRGWVLANVIFGAVAGVLLVLDLSIYDNMANQAPEPG